MLKFLEELVNIIRDRKNSNSEKSYTSQLLNDKKMNVAKVNEEVKELIEAIEKKMTIKFMRQPMCYIIYWYY